VALASLLCLDDLKVGLLVGGLEMGEDEVGVPVVGLLVGGLEMGEDVEGVPVVG
jgi:hypothetical protein